MTTPIKPMSAKETIENAVALFMKQTELDKLKVNSIDLELADKMQQIIIGAYRVSVANVVRTALASHLAYVKEKMKDEPLPVPYSVETYNLPEAVVRNDGREICRTIIQSEIDELTK